MALQIWIFGTVAAESTRKRCHTCERALRSPRGCTWIALTGPRGDSASLPASHVTRRFPRHLLKPGTECLRTSFISSKTAQPASSVRLVPQHPMSRLSSAMLQIAAVSITPAQNCVPNTLMSPAARLLHRILAKQSMKLRIPVHPAHDAGHAILPRSHRDRDF